tara:strand:- start:1889 stop:2041 length:153 start_codon:yes stop_codon:yes gene_type:complete
MVELLELVQAGLAVTAVGLSVAVTPVSIISGEPIPDLEPLMEQLQKKDIR